MKTLSSPQFINPFGMEAFLEAWTSELMPKFKVKPLEQNFMIYSRPVLRGLIHFKELRLSGWNSAWSQELSIDRINSLKTVTAQAPWDYLKIIIDDNSENSHYQAALNDISQHLLVLPESPHYLADLSQGWQGYLDAKERKSRQSITRRIRQAESLNPKFKAYEGDGAVDQFFEQFFPLHRQYWRNKQGHSYFEDSHERNFVIEWAKKLQNTGHLCMDGLMLNDTLVTLHMSLIYQDTLFSWITVHTGEYPELYPGLLARYLKMRAAAEMGITWFHMGPGEYQFKKEAATHQLHRHSWLLMNPKSLKAQLYAQWLQRQRSGHPHGDFDKTDA